MSIADRRNSLRKSSIGVDSIRKSVTSLGEGLTAIGNKSSELLKQTRLTNQFKSKLIKQDGEFFRKRRESVLRKQREDELEASTITGVTKRQGSLVQKSTRGFLGRILDFVGILIIGWAITNLPRIISAFQKLFGFINRLVGILGAFVEGLKNFFTGIGTGIDNFLNIFNRFDFREDDKKIKDTFEESNNNLTKLNKDFLESVSQFSRDEDINRAGQVAADLGIGEGGEGGDIGEDSFGGFSAENEKEVSAAVQTFTEEEVDVIEETGVIPEPRAEGGPVIEGRPYIVGEEGEELFVPNESGEIIPNDELDQTLGDATNIEGTVNVLEASRNNDVDLVINTSTSETYGTAIYTPIDESHPMQGQSPYSASKIAADKLAESYFSSFSLPVVTVRPFNVYGPRQSSRAIIPTIISQLLTREKVHLGDLTPVRDFTFVTDTVLGFIKAAESDDIAGQVINIGNGKASSIGDLANIIMKVSGIKKEIITENERIRPEKSEVFELICDNKKASELIGWEPSIDFNSGMEKTIEFVSENIHLFKSNNYLV